MKESISSLNYKTQIKQMSFHTTLLVLTASIFMVLLPSNKNIICLGEVSHWSTMEQIESTSSAPAARVSMNRIKIIRLTPSDRMIESFAMVENVLLEADFKGINP